MELEHLTIEITADTEPFKASLEELEGLVTQIERRYRRRLLEAASGVQANVSAAPSQQIRLSNAQTISEIARRLERTQLRR